AIIRLNEVIYLRSAYELRYAARLHLAENFGRIILSSIVVTLVLFSLSMLSNRTSGLYDWVNELSSPARVEKMNVWMDEYRAAVMAGDDAAIEALAKSKPIPPFPSVPAMGIVLTVLLELASAAISAGYSGYFLKRVRGRDAGVRDAFPGFKNAVRILIINLFVGIAVGFGFLLFVLPGIILSYRYRLVYYVMFDNPQMGPIACMRESGRLMRGNKARLFRLDLSFLGWIILAAVVSAIFLPVLDIWLTPYIELSRAYFYLDLVPNGDWGREDDRI
ncbi:MAG: DUF975 family protein, partial [Oscillospiraceae bacterium]|nr:DUF975 family protein [Oscillospiraceae bacterium]